MTRDRLLLRGMEFYGYHGVRPEEKRLGQRFVVDVELETDLSAAARTDDLEQTINYSQVFGLVREVVEGPASNLLEAVAERVAEGVLARWPSVEAVRVRVKKPCAPISGGHLEYAGVEVYRQR